MVKVKSSENEWQQISTILNIILMEIFTIIFTINYFVLYLKIIYIIRNKNMTYLNYRIKQKHFKRTLFTAAV